MEIKVFRPSSAEALYLALSEFDDHVGLHVVDAAGVWQADLLRINEKGIYRVADINKKDVHGIQLDDAGRLEIHEDDPVDA